MDPIVKIDEKGWISGDATVIYGVAEGLLHATDDLTRGWVAAVTGIVQNAICDLNELNDDGQGGSTRGGVAYSNDSVMLKYDHDERTDEKPGNAVRVGPG